MRKEIVDTKDGSSSIYLPEMDEHYHSINGSIAESQHIFINMGLSEMLSHKNDIRILEVGMGTGLNVLTTYLHAKSTKVSINYHGLEAFPLDWRILNQLNFARHIGTVEADTIYKKIHNQPWNELAVLSQGFNLIKIEAKIQDVEFSEKFDLVYFDAFAPEKQEEMWEKGIFQKLFDAMSDHSIIVTYCVKGVVRRMLQSIGFKIEKLPGPMGGKREMLRARKIVE